MEKNNPKVLGDESIFPDEHVLQGVLGESYAAYCDLIKLYADHEMAHEWRYYHDGPCWLCKVQKKKKTLVWMAAHQGYLSATIYFPEKYIEAVFNLDIAETWKEKFRTAKQTGKSMACTFEVRESGVLADFEKVMELKMGVR